MPALAITDLGNLFGALEFSSACRKNGIQPIIGCEMMIDFKVEKTFSSLDFERSLTKLVLIAKNENGYKNLTNLVSYSFLNRKNGISTHIDFDKLREKSDGLIALSASVDGILAKMILDEQEKKITDLISRLKDNFRDNFYIEITRNNTEIEKKLEKNFIDIAFKHSIPLVATNNIYFLQEDLYEAQDVLMCIGEARFLVETDRKQISPEQYFKSQKTMEELFYDIPEAIENTINIAKKCFAMAFERAPTLPKFSNAKNFDEKKELEFQAVEGLKSRLEKKFELEKIIDESKKNEIKKIYEDRLNYELSIINKMSFADYFLIVSDFIKWSKEKNIPVGPGRGSGAGSIVAWVLQITDLDPIRFGLLFERFLNPERVSMPDFDIDFCQERRDEVIEYVRQRYDLQGANDIKNIFVAQIITFGKLQAKAVLKDVGRVLQMPYSQVDRICKLIPFNAIEAVTLEKAIEMDKDLQQAIKTDPQVTKLVDIALKLEGLNRHASTHAAGIVIGDKPLTEICALYIDEAGAFPAVGYSMKHAENAGLVKFDFLGLKTLTVIFETVKLIEKTRGIRLDVNNLHLDDKETFKMLSSGDSIGVFQIESSGMRSTLKQMEADKIEDIIALISLYRPGPMDNIPTYIKRKHGDEKITYPHPLLEEVLRESYGVIVYQEQVMEIAKVLAGYSLGAADLLRRAMGKKIKEEMEQQRKIFIDGCIKNEIKNKKAEEIFELVYKFAGYGFNKSHAAGYAMISYQTAYLKAHFPVEFITASINLEIDNADKISVFLQVAKNHNIKILPPNINKSAGLFDVEVI
jgi:DNA polymerase-3 subunit alpha